MASGKPKRVQSERFAFGENWRRFLQVLDEERIEEAERSLRQGLEVDTLAGKSFLDAGCGSGLFSLAARRMGASPVRSFDYDPQSVACARVLRQCFFSGDEAWQVEEGSVLDPAYLKRLGTFDVVYAWGVLHHTGRMGQAMDNVAQIVAPDGRLFISIYNRQPYWSAFNRVMKRAYVQAPRVGKRLIFGAFAMSRIARGAAKDLLFLRNPVQRYRDKKKSRGMSVVHDWRDWVGGYPFEVARPEEVFHFYRDRGFELVKLKTVGGGPGCNEFVFKKKAAVAAASNRLTSK